MESIDISIVFHYTIMYRFSAIISVNFPYFYISIFQQYFSSVNN